MIIYKATNNVNLKIYIGQTKLTLVKRMYGHKSNAYNPKKKKYYFHKAILKHGWDNFTWEILCYCSTIEELNNKEQEFIKKFNTNNAEFGYNLSEGGEINPMDNPIIIDKHYKAILLLSKDPTWIEAHRKGGEKVKSTYEITFPDGNVEIVKGMNQFCKEHNLQQSKMSSVSTGNRPHHKGFKCKLIEQGCKSISMPSNNKTYEFISPEGIHLTIDKLREFCVDKNLTYECMLYVYQGKQPKHKGYSKFIN